MGCKLHKFKAFLTLLFFQNITEMENQKEL